MLATRILTAIVLVPAVLAALFLFSPLGWGGAGSKDSAWGCRATPIAVFRPKGCTSLPSISFMVVAAAFNSS
jgi:hypothetical protein